nr:unnamed protein product [Spirometra erinaceieuropaei]
MSENGALSISVRNGDKPEDVPDPLTYSLETVYGEAGYLNLVRRVLREGVQRQDRTGTGTWSIFGPQIRFNLRSGDFPLLTTKQMFFRGILEELLWFIQGATDSRKLTEKKVFFWDTSGSRAFLDQQGFVDREEGDVGPVYGFQWRHAGAEYTDYKHDYTGEGGLVVPFNIASYALLMLMIAHITGLKPGDFVHTLGDCHVYTTHKEALKKQLKRVPRPFPKLVIKRQVTDIDDFKAEDFEIRVYDASVRSIFLCGSKCWAVRVEDERKLEVFDHCCLRTIPRVKYIDFISNETIRARCEIVARITQAIQKGRLKWLTHVIRRLPQELRVTALDQTPLPHCRRRREGQIKTWLDTVRQDMDVVLGPLVFGLRRWRREWVELSRSAAADRRSWRGTLRDIIKAG